MDQGSFGRLVRSFARLPGLGPRSARRIALYLLTEAEGGQAGTLVSTLNDAILTLKRCSVCGNLDDNDPCRLCTDDSRESSLLCIVAGVADIWAIEQTRQFKGLYHVLGGVLSPIDGVTPDMIRLDSLADRLLRGRVREVILALPATVEGQTTAHYLSDWIAGRLDKASRPAITRLAFGLPMGGELDYLDEATISAAFKARAVI